MVLGKIASDIYNESKKVAPLRHVGIRKSKLVFAPAPVAKPEPQEAAEAEAQAETTAAA
jgi:ribosomal protein S3AE